MIHLGELKEILNRQQVMVCELSQQLNKQKNTTILHKKEMGEVKDTITMHTGEDIPVLRKELEEVRKIYCGNEYMVIFSG